MDFREPGRDDTVHVAERLVPAVGFDWGRVGSPDIDL